MSAGLKQVDKIQIYTGSGDRASGTTSSFALQASTQLYHTNTTLYKVFLQQIVMKNDFQPINNNNNLFYIGITITRALNSSNNQFYIRGSTGSIFTLVTLPTGTYNQQQIVNYLNANYAGGITHFDWALGTGTLAGRLLCAYGTTGEATAQTGGNGVQFAFTAGNGSIADLLGFPGGAGQTTAFVRSGAQAMLLAPGPLSFTVRLPIGQPTIAQILTSINSQLVAQSSSIVMSQDTTGGTGFINFNTSVDLDFRSPQSSGVANLFGYTPGQFYLSQFSGDTLLVSPVIDMVNVVSTIPASHYVIENGQLSLSNITVGMPVINPYGSLIVYSDPQGANASYERNQDRLVNMQFNVTDQNGNAVLPGQDWYMIITIEIYEEQGNQEVALLSEANALLKQQLDLARIGITGQSLAGTPSTHFVNNRLAERPIF